MACTGAAAAADLDVLHPEFQPEGAAGAAGGDGGGGSERFDHHGNIAGVHVVKAFATESAGDQKISGELRYVQGAGAGADQDVRGFSAGDPVDRDGVAFVAVSGGGHSDDSRQMAAGDLFMLGGAMGTILGRCSRWATSTSISKRDGFITAVVRSFDGSADGGGKRLIRGELPDGPGMSRLKMFRLVMTRISRSL